MILGDGNLEEEREGEERGGGGGRGGKKGRSWETILNEQLSLASGLWKGAKEEEELQDERDTRLGFDASRSRHFSFPFVSFPKPTLPFLIQHEP